MQSPAEVTKSVTKFDSSGYLVDYCPHCNEDVSYKNNKERTGHKFINESGYYDRSVIYKCNVSNKFFYTIG